VKTFDGSNAAQHSVHPTGGSLRVFRRFSWLEVRSGKVAFSRPAHQRVTQTVGRRGEITDGSLDGQVELLQHHAHPRRQMKMNCTPSYRGGASCAAWRNKISFCSSALAALGCPLSVDARVCQRRKCLVKASSKVSRSPGQSAPNNACT
jgi:hypothetical protein